jgi:hypothetical protein
MVHYQQKAQEFGLDRVTCASTMSATRDSPASPVSNIHVASPPVVTYHIRHHIQRSVALPTTLPPPPPPSCLIYLSLSKQEV